MRWGLNPQTPIYIPKNFPMNYGVICWSRSWVPEFHAKRVLGFACKSRLHVVRGGHADQYIHAYLGDMKFEVYIHTYFMDNTNKVMW